MHSVDRTYNYSNQQRQPHYRQPVFREITQSPANNPTNMSDAGYNGLDSSSPVKRGIASFEALNDSPERRSNSGISPWSAAGSSVKMKRSKPPDIIDEITQKDSTTTEASQFRKNRLQRAMKDKLHNQQPEPGSLMQKRLSAKERRMASMQQQPSPASDMYHKEQRQPSSRHGSHRGQQLSPKGLTSPSSVSTSRSQRSNSAHRRSGQQSPVPSMSSNNSNGGRSHASHSPNMRVATAAAQQHRASHYSNNYNGMRQQQQQQQPQQQQQMQEPAQNLGKVSSTGSSGDQDSQYKTSKAGPLSRFHKLKMKGMDHHKLAQKRKQAAQKNTSNPNGSATEDRKPPATAQHQRSPRYHQDQNQNLHQQHPPYQNNYVHATQSAQAPTTNLKSQDHHLPNHQLTDDDATLTSVARVLDQEQAFDRHRSGGTPSSHYGASHHYHKNGTDKASQMWVVEDEKSDKAMNEHSPRFHHQHQHQHPPPHHHHHHNAGIYPRPSSSSEFEPEVHPRSPSQYASLSKSGGVTPSPQHARQHPRRHQVEHQHASNSKQQQHQQHYHVQQQYGQGGGLHQHYSPPQANGLMSPQDRVGSGGLLRRSGGSYPSTAGQQFYQSASNRLDDDDRTFDYGVKDDDSQGSTTFQQQLLEAERKAREQSHLSEGNTSNMSQQSGSVSKRQSRRNQTSPLLKTDDPMEQYRQTMDTPVMKTTCGVIGAATLGCVVIGPVGMLLGAAAVGIGVGVMQIPDEQRSNMANKATETLRKVEQQAIEASESLSNSCASTYKDSGISEHIPAEMSKFCAPSEDDVDRAHAITHNVKSQDSEAVRLDQVTGTCGGGGGVGGEGLPMLKNQDSRKPVSPNQAKSLRNKKVACLRNVKIKSISQIHGLEPSAQPHAWLQVLASADTTNDEKNEAMEEILILAKDKQRARIFLEEGILDSLMWILSRFFEKQNRKPTEEWANPVITSEERNTAKLAANCCVTLGKSHCAAIHTEGDLLLMSLYERGTVPEERQLAQMLYEVPHHARSTKTNDPTVIDPNVEEFELKQLTLPQAEEVANKVKALADGK